MQLPTSRIELAADQLESRYSINAVKYDVENRKFIATDGHILACIPATVTEEDHSVLIGLDTMKQLRAIRKQDKNTMEVKTNGAIQVSSVNGKAEFNRVEGTFPNYEAVKPAFEGKATVSIDAALLMRLAQALSGENSPKMARVELWIKDANSAIGVKVSDNPDSWGALMPCR